MTKLASAIAALLILNGCGGGGSNSPVSTSTPPVTPTPTPTPTPSPIEDVKVSLTAYFVKGPVNNGQCELFAINDGLKSQQLAVAMTNEQGIANFGDEVPATDEVLVECSGGNYIDEFTERTSQGITPITRVVTALDGSEGERFSVSVTPLTEIATLMAFTQDNSLSPLLSGAYYQQVSNAFGFDNQSNIGLIQPLNLLNTIVSEDTIEAQYGYALALFSYLKNTDVDRSWTQVLADDLLAQQANGESVFSVQIRENLGNATGHYLSFGSLINSSLQGVNIRRSMMQRGQFILPEDNEPIKTLSITKPLATIRSELVSHIKANNIVPIPAAPPVTDAMFALGQALAFDKLLSGNRDTSCMSCHHPLLATGDARSLSLGTGSQGLGQNRAGGDVIARHAQPLFNLDLFKNMFWDGRVELNENNTFKTPADVTGDLTSEMERVFLATPENDGFTGYGVVAAQAMFPVADVHEMRGLPSATNELARFKPDEFSEIWQAIMLRLGAIEDYVALFEAAYPTVKFSDMTFAHAANAIAAFEIKAFDFRDNPWQSVINDVADNGELNVPEVFDENTTRGAHFFFETGCINCHQGAVMSDFDFHSLAFAQFGPGKGNGTSGFEDFGRENVTNNNRDRAKFRTAPLFNVDLTAPYAHLGQFGSLWSHIQTYAIPERFWINLYTGYDRIVGDFVHVPTFNQEITASEQGLLQAIALPSFNGESYGFIRTLDYIETKLAQAMADPGRLTLEEGKRMGDGELGLHRQILIPFMEAQTDERARDLSHVIPRTVPSGLEVERRLNR